MKTRKICIVDDEPTMRLFLKKLITEITSVYEIVFFADGREIYDYLVKHKNEEDMLPEIIFLDLNMPYMDGFRVLEKFEEIKSTLARDVKIYVVSSIVHKGTIKTIKANPNVIDFLEKPVQQTALQIIFNN